ncbi:DUF4435 domain-containing protein [Aeromonas schubertii]
MHQRISIGQTKMLMRSTAARFAASKFYENFNDIDVFIEDTAQGYTKIFSILLTRCLSKNISLDKVFPLGSRDNVIDAANRSLINENGRSSIYIIDGDLYLLCGEPVTLPKNVIRLNKYCIENFLLDRHAITQVFFEETAEKSMQEIDNEISLDKWIDENINELKKLFIWFAVSQKLKSGIPTIAMGYKSVCNQGNVSAERVEAICTEIQTKLAEKNDINTIQKAYDEIIRNINSELCFVKHYVSAKDFLLPLFLIKARVLTGSKASNLNIKLRLANLCDTKDITQLIHTMSLVTNRMDLLQE